MINAEVMLVLKTGKRPPGKKTSVSNPYPPGNCLLFDPTSSRNFRCPQWGGGGGGGGGEGVRIFSGTTHWNSRLFWREIA